MKNFKKVLSFALALLMVVGCLVAVPVDAKADTTADHVVIHEVYGGGGNKNATYTNDYIVLYNPTASDVSLSGWSVQYVSKAGNFANATKTELSGTIKAGSYYLIQQAAGTAVTDKPLPVTANATGTLSLSGTDGIVVLVKSTELATGATDSNVVDLVGFGTAKAYETAAAPAPSNTTSIKRTALGVDTNDNSADFAAGAIDLSYLTGESNDEEDDDPIEPTLGTIAEALAAANDTECKVKGVVTFISGKDVYVQDATGGIGLYFNSAPSDIKLGDTIEATGIRGAYGGMPQLASAQCAKSEGLTLSAKETTIGALTDSDLGTYVKITGLEVTAINSTNVTLKDAEGEQIKLYKGSYGSDVVVGATVDVLAALGTYSGYQLRNSVESEITVVAGPSDPTEPTEPTLGTIAEALAAADDAECKVKGVVTFVSGKDVYVQDATGGIGLRFDTAPSDIKLGDTIEATGSKGAFGGMPQLNYAVYTKSEGLTLSAKETTIGALKDADLGTYVKIKGLEVTKIDSSNVTLKDAEGNQINLYKGTIGSDVVVGATVDVLAALGTYNGYQLRNSVETEITVVVAGKEDSSESTTESETESKTESEKTLTPAEIMALAEALKEGESLEGEYTLTGKVLEVSEVSSYGDVNVTLEVDGTDGKTIYCYGVKGDGNTEIKVGDKITVTGSIKNYKNTVEFYLPQFIPAKGDLSSMAVYMILFAGVALVAVAFVGKRKMA